MTDRIPDEQILAWEEQFFEETGKSARHLLDVSLAEREVATQAAYTQRLLGMISGSGFEAFQSAGAQLQNTAASQRGVGLANALGQAFR